MALFLLFTVIDMLYINNPADDVICNISIYTNETTLHSKCDEASDLWQQFELASKFEPDLQDTVDSGNTWLVDFNPGKTQLKQFDWCSNNGSIDVKMNGSVLSKNYLFKLDGGSSIISIAKTASKKIGALIRFMKFLSPEVALYLYKSTIRSCMEYCHHIWTGAPSFYLELLDKLQKRISRTASPSLAACL